jgi:hypothetical protein
VFHSFGSFAIVVVSLFFVSLFFHVSVSNSLFFLMTNVLCTS